MYKPNNLKHDEFVTKVSSELSPYADAGIMEPVKLCDVLNDIYFVINMKKPVEEFGYESLLFPISIDQMLAIREHLNLGKMDLKGLKNLTPENIIDITHPIDAPSEKQISMRDIGPTEFEKKVTNIIRLLQGNGAKVEWNEKIKDPSNPNQTRQIDISITRNGKKYHMECRHRTSPQDVQWIEQLVGRRITLGVDGVAGVSSSGFSKTAKKTASNFGVSLWSLSEFNAVDALFWVENFRFSMTRYKIKRVALLFKLKGNESVEEAYSEISSVCKASSGIWRNLEINLNNLTLNKSQLKLEPRHTYLYEFPVTSHIEYEYIDGIRAKLDIECECLHAQRISKHNFGEYSGEFLNTDAIIEERVLPNFKTEVIYSDGKVRLVLEYEKNEEENSYYHSPLINIESGELVSKEVSLQIKNRDLSSIPIDLITEVVDDIEYHISLRRVLRAAYN